MNIYGYSDYKEFVRSWVQNLPNGGRGQYQKIALHLKIHRTTTSQIFQGDKELSLEQACDLTDYLGLSKDESAYFLIMVQRARAGSKNLEKKLDAMLRKLRKDAENHPVRIEADLELESAIQSRFYSNWYYSGVRVLCSIPGFQNADAISTHFALDRKLVSEAIRFLREAKLCELNSKGELQPTGNSTYLSPHSPYIDSHRRNWRIKAMERFSVLSPGELAFSAPLSLSLADASKFRKRFADLIEELYAVAKKSAPETMMVFNLDWIKL